MTNHIYAPVAFLINEAFYQSLSDENRQIIETAAVNARDFQRELSADLREKRLQEMKEAGLRVTELSPEALAEFQASARPIYEELGSVIDQALLNRILALQ